MGNCMGVNSYCNRGRNRNRSRPQNVGICASSTSVLNQQQNLSAPQQQQQQQQQTQQISIPIDSNISIQSGQTNPTITPDPNLTVPNSNLASGSNINQIISNHISSYNLYPYYVPPATGKNKRLKKDFHKYFKFDKKITEKQLQAKRDEFWDTAPAFDGKTEIWAALKAAVEACENKNHQLAQAIIDSANIILPNGLLNDCYDELGNRYEIPIYVLAKPSNLVKSQNNKNEISFDEDSSSCSNKHNKNKTKINDNNIVSDDEEEEIDDLDINCNNDTSLDEDNSDFDQENNNSNPTALDTIKTERKKDSKKLFLSSKSKFNNIKLKLSNRNDDKNNNNNKYDANKKSKTKKQSNNNVNKTEATTSKNKLVTLKLRVSALHNEQDDIKININLNQTVLNLKQMLQEYINVEPVQQRMFFGGKQLKDRDRLKLYRLRRNVVIQVIIKDADDDKIKSNFENYLKQKEKEFLDNNNSNINNDFVFIENQIQIQSLNSSLDKPNETINELNNDESLTVINEDKVNENSNKDLILNDNLINQI